MFSHGDEVVITITAAGNFFFFFFFFNAWRIRFYHFFVSTTNIHRHLQNVANIVKSLSHLLSYCRFWINEIHSRESETFQ